MITCLELATLASASSTVAFAQRFATVSVYIVHDQAAFVVTEKFVPVARPVVSVTAITSSIIIPFHTSLAKSTPQVVIALEVRLLENIRVQKSAIYILLNVSD